MFSNFVFSFCEKFFQLKAKYSDKKNTATRKKQRQEKYSDKIHQAVKCLHKTSHVGSKLRFKNAQVASALSKYLYVFFLTKSERKKKKKTRKTPKKTDAKSVKRFLAPTVVLSLFCRISSLKNGINVREFQETANLYLRQAVECLAGSLKC